MPGARMGESMKDKRSWFYGDDPKTLKADKRLRVDSLPSKLMSVKAAAELLGFSSDAIYEWVRSGRLGCEKIGRTFRQTT